MAAAERIEDLGVAREKLRCLLREDIFPLCKSKHDVDSFIAEYSDKDSLEDLHGNIRYIGEVLWELLSVLEGEEE